MVRALAAAAIVWALLSGTASAPGARGRPEPGASRKGSAQAGSIVKKGSVTWKLRNPAGRSLAAALARVSQTPPAVITLRNLHTGELLAARGSETPARDLVNRLLRCRWTGRLTAMDPRLLPWILEAARHFGSREVQLVSAFRHAKFNEVLRKKGHEVARRSLHRLGQAVDFRLVDADVSVEDLVAFLRAKRWGGVGRYPHSRFVHLDTGPVRSWGGR
ncbi:MAG: DUF882 domain-containing protein [Polyangia bacterium]|nr:DUF882 domain-containing protein [Polyangia bacterium]